MPVKELFSNLFRSTTAEARLDFVAIGDMVTDAFILLREAEVHENMDHVKKEICMAWGQKIPFDRVEVVYAVGNAANAAVSAARLGLNTAFITNQGDDDVAEKQGDALTKNGVSTRYVVSHKGMPSNYHFVLSFKGERTILIKHEAYPRHLPKDFPPPRWLYLSSFGEHSEEFRAELQSYLAKHPDVEVAFQPGVFEFRADPESMRWLYARSSIFFCNIEEAQTILKTQTREVRELAEGIHKLGPKKVCLTDGPAGAYGFDSETGAVYFVPEYPDPATPVDRTGAGDAFASTVTVALALGKSLEEALAWGPVNSMSVVQKVGAQAGLLSRGDLEKFLLDAPESYRVSSL